VEGNATDPSVSRIGLVTFSDSAKIEFDLDDYRERTELLQAINVHYSGGTTNTPDAIRYKSTNYNDRHAFTVVCSLIVHTYAYDT